MICLGVRVVRRWSVLCFALLLGGCHDVSNVAPPCVGDLCDGGARDASVDRPLLDLGPPDVGTDHPVPDAPAPDLWKPDAPAPDGSTPDLLQPDAPKPDAPKPDLAQPDLAQPDLAQPDLAPPDLAPPDLAPPDLAPPDLLPPDLPAPDMGCTSAQDCDDSLTCTTDSCAAGVCKNMPDALHCVIGGACVFGLTVNKKNTCQRCDPSANKYGWSDHNNKACDDGYACTHGDTCNGGKCQGTLYSCDDNLACTTDACLGTKDACTHTLKASHCLINKVCYSEGQTDGSNVCKACVSAASTSAWSLASGCVATLTGTGSPGYKNGPASTATITSPYGVGVDQSGRVFFSSTKGGYLGGSIRYVEKGTVYSRIAGGSPNCGNTGRVEGVKALAVSLGGGAVYFHSCSHRIVVHTGNAANPAKCLACSSTPGYKDGLLNVALFNNPRGLAITSAGVLYVSDTGNHVVRMIANGVSLPVAGVGQKDGFQDGLVNTAKFHGPLGLAVATNGDVYVADSGNNRIRVISAGKVSTFAGAGGAGDVDGPAATATFFWPVDVALGPAGKLYVVDAGNHRIRVIAGGKVSTLAGTTKGYKEGKGTVAQFSTPQGVAVDKQGMVYVADTVNHRIRVIRP